MQTITNLPNKWSYVIGPYNSPVAVVKPGETFEVIFELDNPAPWSAASSIEILFSSLEEGVYVDGNSSSIITFETVEAGETFSNINMPFIVTVDEDIQLAYLF